MVMPNSPLIYYPDLSLVIGAFLYIMGKIVGLTGANVLDLKALVMALIILSVVFIYFTHIVLRTFGF